MFFAVERQLNDNRLNDLFLVQMQYELNRNKTKGVWQHWRPTVLEAREELSHHFVKLDNELAEGKFANIAERSADLANICMKIFETFKV